MKIKFELNGKALLAVGLLSAGLAFGEYVSVINSEEVSYSSAIPEKEIQTVGAIVLRTDSTNPADIYGGTWRLITGDASIRLGDGTQQDLTSVSGDNTPIVPLQEHDHTAIFSGDALPNHTHNLYTDRNDSGDYHARGSRYGHVGSGYSPVVNSGTSWIKGSSAGTPTGTISLAKAGVTNATLNVRGAFITVNVWEKISE